MKLAHFYIQQLNPGKICVLVFFFSNDPVPFWPTTTLAQVLFIYAFIYLITYLNNLFTYVINV